MKAHVSAIALLILAWPTIVAADIYYCGLKDGVPWYAIGTRPRGAKCSQIRLASAPGPQGKGAKCVVQTYKTSAFYRCEKDGMVWIFNRKIAALKGEASGEPRRDNDVVEVEKSRPDEATLQRIVARAAAQTGVPEALLMAVMYVESKFRPDAVSVAGAQGLMQLMPATADYLDVEDPFDPEQNVLGGAKLLRELADRFDGDIEKALAAYYSGPGAVIRAGGYPDEACASYVRKVLDHYRRYAREMRSSGGKE